MLGISAAHVAVPGLASMRALIDPVAADLRDWLIRELFTRKDSSSLLYRSKNPQMSVTRTIFNFQILGKLKVNRLNTF